jgi:hypothetical protein
MGICTHLDDYGTQFAATEAAYRQCVALVDAIVAEGPGNGRAPTVIKAIEDWRQHDNRLRALLVDLVKAGRARIPRRMAAPGHHRHAGGMQDHIICASCRRAVPRLKYEEWKFAHNGVVSYRGNEFDLHRTAASLRVAR